MARDKPLANLLAAIAAIWGSELDIDDQLRAWGHSIKRPDFDANKNARAILSDFGG